MKLFQQCWGLKLGYCGCGNPNCVLELIRDVLDCLSLRYRDIHNLDPISDDAWEESYGKLEEIFPERGPLFHVILYDLNRADLLEHGGSVAGSWPTDYGMDILSIIKEFGVEYLLDADPVCICDNQNCPDAEGNHPKGEPFDA